MMIGLFMMLYVGGLIVDEQQNAYAANGANDVAVQEVPESNPAPNGMGVVKYRPPLGPDVPQPTPTSVVPAQTEQDALAPSRASIPTEAESQDVLSNAVPEREPQGEP